MLGEEMISSGRFSLGIKEEKIWETGGKQGGRRNTSIQSVRGKYC